MTTFFLFLLLCTHQSLVTSTTTIVSDTTTVTSPNNTFSLGFFSPTGTSTFYLAIWYSSIPLPTYVWVANRLSPILHPPATLSLSSSGHLTLLDASNLTLWSSSNTLPGANLRFLDNGNLLLLDNHANVVWQSFDFPTDTWLPGMPLSRRHLLTSWRNPSDPTPGPYHLRLKPPEYGEVELIYLNLSQTPHPQPVPYWSTGSWLGDRFSGVPEMTVPYIYDFHFDKPYTENARFSYTLKPGASLGEPLLTRFSVSSSGQLRQYTWSAQMSSWNMFWLRPENPCKVHRLCGNLGFCDRASWFRPCECLIRFRPSDPPSWNSGDFSGGCTSSTPRLNSCTELGNYDFVEIGKVELDAEILTAHPDVEKGSCEELCRRNCSCVGFSYDLPSRVCRTMFGNVINLSNTSLASSMAIFLKVPASSSSSSKSSEQSNGRWRRIATASGSVGGFLAATGVAALVVTLRYRPRRGKKEKGARGGEEEGGVYVAGAIANLQVLSYKEISTATKGFTDELGRGGFGAVFRGVLPDSSQVAVKRLKRPSGGDREFRAEVRTIGSIQHVNLVRLRGFCSEGPHRVLVYEYMPGGPLSAYLRRSSSTCRQPPLPWKVRFGVAVGTARGIAYLHEECRDCIIHCDIKPENILLDSGFAPKISDFGLAKLVGREFSRVLTTMRGTWGYVAPEWISGLAITAKADVYSYGMTLMEILAGRRNVAGGGEGQRGEEEGGWFLPPWAAKEVVEGNVEAVVDAALGEEYDRGEAERVGRVAVWCIQDGETARPSMGMVVKMLEGTVEVGVPPLPGLLQSLVSGDSFPKEGIALAASTPSSGSEGRNSVSGASAGLEVAGRSAHPR